MRSYLAFIYRQTRKPHFIAISLTSGLITGRISKKTTNFNSFFFLKGYLYSKSKPIVHAETKTSSIIGERKPALPTYSMTEIAKHTTKEKGVNGFKIDV